MHLMKQFYRELNKFIAHEPINIITVSGDEPTTAWINIQNVQVMN